jgi:hypothetical protein
MLSHAHRRIGKVVISYRMEEAGEALFCHSDS